VRKINEKDGCTLMVTMEMITSSLILPFIICKGGFGKKLMTTWKEHHVETTRNAMVVFTENHWQKENTMKTYLNGIHQLFPG